MNMAATYKDDWQRRYCCTNVANCCCCHWWPLLKLFEQRQQQRQKQKIRQSALNRLRLFGRRRDVRAPVGGASRVGRPTRFQGPRPPLSPSLSWWVALHGSPRAIRMFTLDVPSNGKIERKEFRFGNNFFETHTHSHTQKHTTSKTLEKDFETRQHRATNNWRFWFPAWKKLCVCLRRKQKLISSCAVDINPSNGFFFISKRRRVGPNSISQECCRTDTFFYKSLISQFWVDKVSVIRCFVLDGERHKLFVVSHENNRLTFTHTNKK